MTSLPTTPGSTITFTSTFELDEGVRYVATLIPGHVTPTGEVLDAVWSSSDISGLDDEHSIFRLELLLEQDFEVLFITEAVTPERPYAGEDGDDFLPGTVIRYLTAEGEESVATYTPGFLDPDESAPVLQELHWVNSYGTYLSPAAFSEAVLSVIYEPAE
jgi:hypothetical protein